MRILAIYRHYWPDSTPYARLLKAILERAASDGHEVVAYAAQPSYNDVTTLRQPARDIVNGVRIRRVRLLPERKRLLPLRALNELYFLFRAVVHALRGPDYDLLLANGRPPVLTACGLWLIGRLTGTPYVLHLQDIHPECLQVVGKLRVGLVYRLLRRLDTRACRDAHCLITLSQDMAQALQERGLDSQKIKVINNSSLPLESHAPVKLPAAFNRSDGTPLFLFAGNLGEFQALDMVVDAAKELSKERPFRLVFLGAGAARPRLIARAGDYLDRTIFYLPYVTPETAFQAMRCSDFGIVSLAHGVYRYAYPSKSMTYLSAGCPIIALVEPASELAQKVAEHKLGYTAAEHSSQSLAQAMRQACESLPVWNARRRQEVATHCDALFGQEQMLAAWMELLSSCATLNAGRWPPAPSIAQAPRHAA
jgi:glycosyltransferase involved in cell wall biosynthesis